MWFGSGYNDRSELTAGDRYQGTDQVTHTGAPFVWDFEYDNIGNRESYDVNDATAPPAVPYDANDLNQYASVGTSPEYLCYDADGRS